MWLQSPCGSACTAIIAPAVQPSPSRSMPAKPRAKLSMPSLRIPATAGTLTLYYPKWIPGEHAPDGPVIDLTGLKFRRGGKPLNGAATFWMAGPSTSKFPAGQNEVLADLDYPRTGHLVGGFSAGSSATDKLLIFSWNQVLLYPKGCKSDDITYSASLRIPEGWKYATLASRQQREWKRPHFSPVSLTMLVDSPVLTGQYLKAVPLTTDRIRPPNWMSPPTAPPPSSRRRSLGSLQESRRAGASLFGAQHYRTITSSTR